MQFTPEEIETILRITNQYGELMQKSMHIQKKIEESEDELQKLAQEMDNLKSGEMHFFYDMAAKYDMEPQTVQNAAANYVLTNRAQNGIPV